VKIDASGETIEEMLKRVISPFVVLRMYGVPHDKMKFRSKTVGTYCNVPVRLN